MVSFLNEMWLNLLYGGLWVGGFIVALLLMAWGFGLYRLLNLEENKAVSMKLLGGHVCSFIQSSTLSFDSRGKVDIGSGAQTFGCLLFPFLFRVRGAVVYLWPLFWPNDYEKTNKKGDGFGAGNFVDLQDIPGEIVTEMAETKDGVPISVTFEVTRRVTDPRAFQYDSPEDVIHQANKRTEAEFARWIVTVTDDQVQAFRGNGEALWDKLEADGFTLFLEVMENGSKGKKGKKPQRAWGLQTIPNSVIIRKIDYDPDYQKAKKARAQADLTAKADAERLAGPVRIALAEYVVSECGPAPVPQDPAAPTPAEAQAITDYEEKVAKFKASKTYLATKRYFENLRASDLTGGKFTRFDVTTGGEGISPAVATALGKIAAALGVSLGLGGGGGQPPQPQPSPSPQPTKPTAHVNKTQAEKANEWAKAHNGQRPGFYKGPRLPDETEQSWKDAGSPT